MVKSDDLRTLSPDECFAQKLTCACYTPQATSYIAQELLECQIERYSLEEYSKLIEIKAASPWYEDPSFIVGSVVVSFSVGALLGYLVTKRNL
jgi:hypothetical protein